jgi:hypothetical protein
MERFAGTAQTTLRRQEVGVQASDARGETSNALAARTPWFGTPSPDSPAVLRDPSLGPLGSASSLGGLLAGIAQILAGGLLTPVPAVSLSVGTPSAPVAPALPPLPRLPSLPGLPLGLGAAGVSALLAAGKGGEGKALIAALAALLLVLWRSALRQSLLAPRGIALAHLVPPG